MDHYRLNYKKTPVLLSFAGLVIRQNESINYHNHIDEYDLEHSPDMTAVITCKTGDKPSFSSLNMNTLEKTSKTQVLLKTKQIVMFDSTLDTLILKKLKSRTCFKFMFEVSINRTLIKF